MSTATAIPCRRPRVDVLDTAARSTTGGRPGLVHVAECRVPGCNWAYGPGVKTDVEQTAVGHRRWHRAAVPASVVRINSGGGYAVSCPCGFVRQDGTTTTRTDAQNVEAHHLSTDHGLVSCA